jgi:hypothetical protein
MQIKHSQFTQFYWEKSVNPEFSLEEQANYRKVAESQTPIFICSHYQPLTGVPDGK